MVMPSRGVEYTVVNGVVTWANGKLTGATAGARPALLTAGARTDSAQIRRGGAGRPAVKRHAS
jgi:hypothetical protein